MVACATLLLHTGQSGLKAIQGAEAHGDRLLPASFRPLEPVYVPADYQLIVDGVLKSEPITMGRLREVTQDVLSDRWWDWCLNHPHMPTTRVHPSRSMLVLCRQLHPLKCF